MTIYIYDNDASSDDMTALIYLASHPKVKLAAITIAGTGEAHGLRGAQNVADLCHLLGKPDIPIAYGTDQPCDNHGTPFPDFIRKAIDKIFENNIVPHQTDSVIGNDAVELMRRTICDAKEPVEIIATGPLTNIAEFIKKYPELAKKIDRITIMGGAVHVPGNIKEVDEKSNNEVAEWNIYADPKAADIVFSSGIPVTLVPLDATNQVPFTREFYASLSQQRQVELRVIYLLLKDVHDQFGEDFFFTHFYLWDPLAAMICVDRNLAVTEKMFLRMNLKNAKTECVDESTHGAGVIDVATKILEPKSVLEKLITQIKSNALNNKFQLIPSSFYHASKADVTINAAEDKRQFREFR